MESNEVKRMSIADAAKHYGISARTLRFYEEEKILTSHRKNDSRYREYDKHQCARIEIILLLRRLSFSVKEIAQLFHGDESRLHTLLHQKLIAGNAALREAKETLSLLQDLMHEFSIKPVAALNVDELLSRYTYLTQKTERMVRMNADKEKYLITLGFELIPMVGGAEVPGSLIEKLIALRETLSAEQNKTFPTVRIIDNTLNAPNEVVLLHEGNELWRKAHDPEKATLVQLADEVIEKLKQDVLTRY